MANYEVAFNNGITTYTLGGTAAGTGVTTGVANVTGMGALVAVADTPLLFSAGSFLGVASYPGRLIGVQFLLRGPAAELLDDMAALRAQWSSSFVALTVKLAAVSWVWNEAVTRSLEFDLSRLASHGIVRGDCSVLTRYPTPDSGTWT